MTKFKVLMIACFLTTFTFAQQHQVLKLSLIQKFSEEVKDFTTDNLGNIYLLKASNQIKKVNGNGDSIAVYNDIRRYGKISSIDASNPLKVLVYYKDFSTIIILDRLLNVRATVDLRKQNILQAKVIATSYDNNIWVYDEMDSRLKKIDDSGQILLESADLRQVFDSVPSPDAMYDRDGQLYLYDYNQGLLVFDYYGAKKNNFKILRLADVQVIDKNTITARDSSYIFLYKPASLQSFSFTAFTNHGAFKKINFNGSLLYALKKENHLEIYRVLK